MPTGFTPSVQRYQVEYEDYPGLVITAIGASMGMLERLAKMPKPVMDPTKDIQNNPTYDFFASRIVEWTMQHPPVDSFGTDHNDMHCPTCGLLEDEPLPPTSHHMRCLDSTLVMKLLKGWMTAVSGVTAPKEKSMSSGDATTLGAQMLRLGEIQNQSPLPMPKFS